MADVTRRRVTYGQLEKLWEFLNQNKAIATGYNKTSQAREYWKKMWEKIAETLNSHGDGAKKDWSGWSKYWVDYKCKLKKLAAANKGVSLQQPGGSPSQIKEMTDIEKKLFQILVEDFGNRLIGMKVEPFKLDTQEMKSDLETPLKISEPTVHESESSSESIQTHSPVQHCEGMSIYIMEPGPSTRVTPSPPASSPTLRHTTTAGPELQGTLRRSLRRRRHRRQEPPMTQEAARQALIRISERRANIEEQNCQTLKYLLQEIKEIKVILRMRSVGHPTDGE